MEYTYIPDIPAQMIEKPITPIRNNVLVKPYPAEEITDTGFYVPENARKISNRVLVISVGSGFPNKPMELKAGQTGYRVKDWGQEIMVNNELHFLMDADAIKAVE